MHEDFTTAWLAAIVDSSDDAIISKDLNGIILTFNPAAERLFGWTAAEIVGRPVTDLIPPGRRDEEVMILGRIRRGERVDHYETVRMTKHGRLLDISLTVSPIRDATGRIVAASKIARDITERKRSAAQLAEQQEWFRVTLGSIGDAVIACDTRCRVTFLNHAAEKLTGWPPAQALGVPLPDVFRVVSERTREPFASPAEQVLRSGHVVALENHAVLIGRDGSEWPIADSAAPIVAADGRVIGVVLAFREITGQRDAETRLRDLALERERLLDAERAARTEAERANRIKDEFMAMVSHELRTPLNAILGWTDLLRRRPADEAVTAHGLTVIARNTRVQAQLIADLLDVSRIVSGKLTLTLDRLDLRQVVENTIDALQPTATEKGVGIATRFEPDAYPLVGDVARLQQVIGNLLSNAIKFSPRDGEVTVSLRHLPMHAEIIVSDHGAGIAPDVLPAIFERFHQGSPATTRRHGGLGLGLSIAKHLVELHGGTLRAHSEGEGLGATFTVELPLRLEAPVPTTGAPAAVADALEPNSLDGISVLVVEDDADTRELVRRVLESHGARVVPAQSAAEALERLHDRTDVLLSDVGLPDVDGYELMARVRRLPEPAGSVPAIALTAFARSVDRTRALRAGFNTHIAKPVEPLELVATVRSFANLVRRA